MGLLEKKKLAETSQYHYRLPLPQFVYVTAELCSNVKAARLLKFPCLSAECGTDRQAETNMREKTNTEGMQETKIKAHSKNEERNKNKQYDKQRKETMVNNTSD